MFPLRVRNVTLRVYENRVLWRIFVPSREEINRSVV